MSYETTTLVAVLEKQLAAVTKERDEAYKFVTAPMDEQTIMRVSAWQREVAKLTAIVEELRSVAEYYGTRMGMGGTARRALERVAKIEQGEGA